VKGTDSKTERYTAHTYTGLHTCGVGEQIHSVTRFLCIDSVINLAEYTVLFYSRSSLVLVVAALWLGRTFLFQRCKCSVLRRWRLPKHADIRLVGVQELASPRRDDHGHA